MNAIACKNVAKSSLQTDDKEKVLSIFKKRKKKAAVKVWSFGLAENYAMRTGKLKRNIYREKDVSLQNQVKILIL